LVIYYFQKEDLVEMTPKKIYYENLADTIIDKFNKRGIEGYYCENAEAALATAKRFLTPGCSISWGGSETLLEIGLLEDLSSSDYILYDRSTAKTPEERQQMYSKIVTADYYFMSSNAITLDGQLVNIDGSGNRVACLLTGPRNVIIIAGMNKIVTDVDIAVDRIRNMATPPNVVRLGKKTPCAETGKCANCLVEDCICNQIVITRRSGIAGRIKVILVGEVLGF
jgi:L-lactate utilization protein LutB